MMETLRSSLGDWHLISGEELGLGAMGHISSMVAGEDDREMELEKQSQELGGECPVRLTSGPSCMWAGTTWSGLASVRGKAAPVGIPKSREYPDQ